MDISLLATFLSPFLPRLLKLGGQAAEKATEVVSEKFGEAAWTKAQKIWGRLHPKVEEKADLKVATEQVAAKPDSRARQSVFQEELETLLNEHPDLAKAIAQIMQEDAPDGTPSNQVVQNVIGNKNQSVGQVFGGKVANVEGNVTM
jgi:transketolase